MNSNERNRLRELERASLAGRWIAGEERDDGTAQVYTTIPPTRAITPVAETRPPEAQLICAARNALVPLLDALDAAEAEIAEYREEGEARSAVGERLTSRQTEAVRRWRKHTARTRVELVAELRCSLMPGREAAAELLEAFEEQ